MLNHSQKYNRILKENEVRRFEELKDLYYRVNGERYDNRIVNKKNNQTLQDISCSASRYSDVVVFYKDILEKKRHTQEKEKIEQLIHKEILNELNEFEDFVNTFVEKITKNEKGKKEFDENYHQIKEEIDEIGNDMNKAEKIYKEAFDLMKNRNEKYGDSWKVLSIQSLANLCEMKLHRISNLDKIEPKIYDELIDTLNYMVFGLMKLKELDSSKKYNK